MQTVAEIGFEQPVTISPDAMLDTALRELLLSRSTELYVTDDDGRLVGVIPDYELLKARLAGSWTELTARQLCSSRVICFTPDTACSAILKAFREGQHSRAAILQDGRLIGQITRAAILHWLMASVEEAPLPVASPKFLQSASTSRVLCGLPKSSPRL
jgi:CBS domain-containing protein